MNVSYQRNLIYQRPDLAPTAPQTHALLIGVGRYPYLQNIDTRLTPLTSSVVSARAVADWLIKTPLHNPAAPLGTVEVLLSAINPADQQYDLADGGSMALDTATWPNIRRAFEGWFERCHRQPNNVALFYFCGHGLQKETTLALLPENFGLNRANEWADTVNFSATYEGMKASCRAQTQCYFIDACRQVDLATLRTADFGGQSLCKSDALSRNNPATLRIFATQTGEPAFGEENQISRLTAVLLQALNQSEQADGRIDLGGLARTIPLLMERANQPLPANKRQRAVPEVAGDAARPIHFTLNKPGVVLAPSLADEVRPVNAARLPPEEEQFLRDLLAQHERNLRTFLKQKSVYGAGEEPLRLLNQIEAEEKAIKDIKQQLGL